MGCSLGRCARLQFECYSESCWESCSGSCSKSCSMIMSIQWGPTNRREVRARWHWHELSRSRVHRSTVRRRARPQAIQRRVFSINCRNKRTVSSTAVAYAIHEIGEINFYRIDAGQTHSVSQRRTACVVHWVTALNWYELIQATHTNHRFTFGDL